MPAAADGLSCHLISPGKNMACLLHNTLFPDTHISYTHFHPPPSIFALLHKLHSETFLEAKLSSQTNIVWAISHPTQAVWGESGGGWKDSQRNGWRVRGQRREPMRNAAANLMTSVEKVGQMSEAKSAGDCWTEVLKSLRVAGSIFSTNYYCKRDFSQPGKLVPIPKCCWSGTMNWSCQWLWTSIFTLP